mgnify:CR=1 FL=1
MSDNELLTKIEALRLDPNAHYLLNFKLAHSASVDTIQKFGEQVAKLVKSIGIKNIMINLLAPNTYDLHVIKIDENGKATYINEDGLDVTTVDA